MNEFEEFRKRAHAVNLGALDSVVTAVGVALIGVELVFRVPGMAILGGLLWIGHGWAALKRGDVVDLWRDNPYGQKIDDQQVEVEDRHHEGLHYWFGWGARDPRRLMFGGSMVLLFGIALLLAR